MFTALGSRQDSVSAAAGGPCPWQQQQQRWRSPSPEAAPCSTPPAGLRPSGTTDGRKEGRMKEEALSLPWPGWQGGDTAVVTPGGPWWVPPPRSVVLPCPPRAFLLTLSDNLAPYC